MSSKYGEEGRGNRGGSNSYYSRNEHSDGGYRGGGGQQEGRREEPRHGDSERRREDPRHGDGERRREDPRHGDGERRREEPRHGDGERRREEPRHGDGERRHDSRYEANHGTYGNNRNGERNFERPQERGNERENRGSSQYSDQRSNPYSQQRDGGARDGGAREGGARDGGVRYGGARDGSGYQRGGDDRRPDRDNGYHRENHGYGSSPRNNQGGHDRDLERSESHQSSQYTHGRETYQRQNGYGAGRDYEREHGYGGGRENRGGSFQNDGNRSGYQNENGYNSRSGSYQKDSGFNNRSGNSQGGFDNRENRNFNNDGGYSNTGEVKEDRAPRGWVPHQREIEELMDSTAQQVSELQVSSDQAVEIRNSDIETRLTSWENSGLHPKILKNLDRLKYKHVRTIQAAMIPQILQGYDVIGQAETSAGKTAAFGLPIVHYILNLDSQTREDAKYDAAPFALILAPTRELAGQISDSLRTFASDTDIKVRLSIGEQSRQRSLEEIRAGCDILVGTCGRMMDLVEKGDILLTHLKFFVLDEADRLLQDKKKDPVGHLGTILNNREFQNSRDKRQTLMTSATFDRSVEAVAAELMKPITGQTDLVRIVLATGRLNNRVNLVFHETVGRTEKQNKICEILEEKNDKGQTPKTLIFVREKKFCDFMAGKLHHLGFETQTLHGDRSQDTRDKLINEFKTGKVNILMTTDVLSRGIDVTDLERVINFDLPDGTADSACDTFIHRSGRTGRMHSGVCHSLIDKTHDNDARLAPKLVELIKSQGREDTLPEFLAILARENANRSDLNDAPYSRRGAPSHGGSNFGSSKVAVTGSFNRAPATGAFASGGFGSSGFGSQSAGTGFGGNSTGPRMGGGFGKSNDEAPSVGGGFGAPKAPSGFGATKPEEEREPSPEVEEVRGFGSKAALASMNLGSSSFGGADDKKEEAEEEDDEDW